MATHVSTYTIGRYEYLLVIRKPPSMHEWRYSTAQTIFECLTGIEATIGNDARYFGLHLY